MRDDEPTRKEFGLALLEAATVRGEQMPTARIRGYFNILIDYDLDVVVKALQLVMKRSKYFPQPADIVAEIDGIPEDRGVRAWDRLLNAVRWIGPYRTVDFKDPVLHTAIEAEGGWHVLTSLLSANPEDLGFVRHRFLERYRAYERYLPGPAPEALLGITAIANESRGGWTHGHDVEDLVAVVSPDGRRVEAERKPALPASSRSIALPAHEGPAVDPPKEVMEVVRRLKEKMSI